MNVSLPTAKELQELATYVQKEKEETLREKALRLMPPYIEKMKEAAHEGEYYCTFYWEDKDISPGFVGEILAKFGYTVRIKPEPDGAGWIEVSWRAI